MKKVRITQTGSGIHRPLRQKKTLEALGLGKMHRTVELEATPQVMGMIDKVKHMLDIQEVE